MVKLCQVIIQHNASYSYSVEFKAGEKVTVSYKTENGWIWCTNKEGKGAWIPKKYLKIRKHSGAILSDYISTELTVKVGDKLKFIKEVSGWAFCVDKDDKRGWIPTHKVESSSEK
jgi:uncharacterized protein YgiM (DUF1202 family)